MSIFSRARDIFAANMGDLLDRAEDPSKMIRMIIMEMEETLVEVRAGAARVIADQKELRRHVGKLTALEDNWTDKAELALSKDREDLAKAALQEKQKATDARERLEGEIARLGETLGIAEKDISKLQTKLTEARTRQSAIQSRIDTAKGRVRAFEAYAGERVKDALSRFDVLEREADHAEGQADALNLGGQPKSLDEEIAELKSSDKVDAALEALKAKLNKGL
ncbi:phage shock protein PspA [Sphingomonas antarctica]|uniref:phage shock protein PspA n=1 Tax=Sphingomonas antarctica TaxID=2040274 RepID=UPI0039EBBA56